MFESNEFYYHSALGLLYMEEVTESNIKFELLLSNKIIMINNNHRWFSSIRKATDTDIEEYLLNKMSLDRRISKSITTYFYYDGDNDNLIISDGGESIFVTSQDLPKLATYLNSLVE